MFALQKQIQMKSPSKKATPKPKIVVNDAPPIVNDGLPNTPIVNDAPPIVNDGLPNTDTVNAETPVVKENDFKVYSCKLSIEEHLHVTKTVNKGIEVGVFENNNDFLRKTIDFYFNHNPVCVAMGLKPHLEIPLLDGRNGSEYVAPKLLKNSLLKGLTNLPQF